MECPICYETVTEDKWQQLECPHALCKICLSRLHHRICPLCREPIAFPYRQRLLPSVNDVNLDNWDLDLINVAWQNVDNYSFEFGIEINLNYLDRVDRVERVEVRRRQRSHRQREQEQDRAVEARAFIPLVVSDVDMQEILRGVDILPENVTLPSSESDRERQKHRNGRNRWKNQNAHITSRR